MIAKSYAITGLLLITLARMTTVNAEEEESFMLDDEDSFMLEDETEESAEEKGFYSYIELGGLYNSSASQKFGEYTGLNKQQGYVIGSFDIRYRDTFDSESARFWRLTGTDLGLDSRSVDAEYGEQGLFKLFFAYDQLPHNRLVGARTPFAGVGTEHLNLPDSWVRGATTTGMTLLNDSLKSVDIGTERRKYNGGFMLDLTQQWNIKFVIQHEDKDGLKDTGAVMGISGFNPLSIVAPKPIDQETNDLDVQVAYNGEKAQVQLAYHFSHFENHITSFSWQNPYELRLPSASGEYLDTVGGLSVAPDNQAHKISLSAAYRLASKTRLNGSFSYGLMRQDDSYLAYTINPLLTVDKSSPRQDADAKVETLHANLVFTSAPIKNLNIRSSYRYDQRSNHSPIEHYDVLRNDSENQITQLSSQTRRRNLTYGRKQHRFKIDTGYRFLARNKLSIGYAYERNNRDYAEVGHTDEHNMHVKLATSLFNKLNGWVKYEYIVRNASEYDGNSLYLQSYSPQYLATLPESVRFENDPLIRQYNLADRKTNKVSFSASWLPFEPLSIGLNGHYRQNNYEQSELGLIYSDSFSGTVDLNYTIHDGLSLYSFYSYEALQNKQNGYTRFSNVGLISRDPDQFWQVDTQDTINTLGLGIDWHVLKNILDLQLDYTYSDALTQTNTRQGSKLSADPLPDLKTTIHSLNLRANYRLLENMRLQLSYRYEFFVTDDYALDNISPDSIDEVLGLGNSSPDYNAHVVGLSVFYEF